MKNCDLTSEEVIVKYGIGNLCWNHKLTWNKSLDLYERVLWNVLKRESVSLGKPSKCL